MEGKGKNKSNYIKELCNACREGDLQRVQHWIQKTTDINGTYKRNEVEYTPLYYAAKKGYLNIVLLLIECGVEINKGIIDNDTSPLIVASYNGHLEVVRALINAGAD